MHLGPTGKLIFQKPFFRFLRDHFSGTQFVILSDRGHSCLQSLHDLMNGALRWISLWVTTRGEFELATTHLSQTFPQTIVKAYIIVHGQIQR